MAGSSTSSNAFSGHKETKMHWEQGSVFDISWSSDGNLLTATGTKGNPRTWRLERGGHKEGEELKALGHNIERLCWNPSQQSAHLLAAASYDRTVQLWDQKQSRVINKMQATGYISDMCWSPVSGRYLATISREEGKLEVFDQAASGALVVSAEVEDIVCTVRWDPTETMLMLGTHQGAVEVYRWPSMQHITRVQAHAAACNCLAFGTPPIASISGKTPMMVTGGADSMIEFWRLCDFSLERSVAAHESPLLFADFSMDSRFLASASDDLAVRVHDTFSGEAVHSLNVDSMTTALEWHPRNLALAYGSAGSSKASVKPTVTIFLKT
ncbi:THO complex subunit 3 [Coemansia sp. Benny D115]|nr:THO complex subunit 3 [Coemansia sp. Benny D115]